MVKLADVADWGSGGTPKRSVPSYFGEGVPWLSIADLNDGIVNAAKESLTVKGVANSSAKSVPAGTIFVAMYGSIGKLGIAGCEMATSQAIAFAKPRRGVVNPRFLFHFLLAQRVKFQALGRGGTQLNIGQADLKAWPMPLPPLDQQRRIADILDKADALRAKRREAIAHFDDLAQSIFHEMFGWMSFEQKLSDVISVLVGGRNIIGTDDSSNPKRVLKISAVTSGTYLESESKPLPDQYAPDDDHVVRQGDVLISRANTTELVGASAIVERTGGKAVLPDKLWRAVPTSGVDSRFLLAALQSREVRAEISRRSTGSGGSMKNISKPNLLGIPAPIPPLKLQQQFADRVAALQRIKAKYQAQLAELDSLFASLQDRAFTGQL